MLGEFANLDIGIFIASVVAIMIVGLWASRHERDTRDFFLAGRKVPFWQVAGSIFASNVSSNHLVGMTGIGFAVGFAQANYEFGAIAGLMLLAYFLLPLYRRTGIYTLSEFLAKRYDDRSRVLYSAISIFGLIAFEMVATLYIGSRALVNLFDFDYRWGIVLFAGVTGVYTILGGLKAVIWTDVIQAVLLLVGAGIVAVLALAKVGGLGALIAAEPDRFHVFFSKNHPDLPWTGVITGLMVLHFHYWGANQFIVQRALGARSDWDGRMGIVLAGFFKLLLPFITIVPGMAAAHFMTLDNSDDAFPQMMRTLLPAGYGLAGIVLAGLIGAILSTFDSMLNSAATLFTFDFYKRFMRPTASERELILIGRIGIGVALVVSGVIAAFYYDPQGGKFFLKLVAKWSFVIPGIMVSFLVGVFWRRASATGSMVAIILGPPVSYLVERIWTRAAGAEPCFLHTVAIATFLCGVVLVIVSLATSRVGAPATADRPVWTAEILRTIHRARRGRPLLSDDRLWASLLIACTVALCIYFA